MNFKAWLVGVGTAVMIGGTGVAAVAQAQADDITLTDGRVVHGQIVMESKDTVVLQMGASHRSFARNFISKIAYGDGGAPVGGAGPSPAAAEAPEAPAQQDLASGLSAQYQVPLKEVLWVRAQGVSDADLPMVFMVAANAQVAPAKVVALLLAGQTWDAIESHFSIQPSGVYYEDEPWGVDPCYEPALVLAPGWDGYWGDGYWGGGWGGHRWHGGWNGGGWNGWHGGGHWNGGHGTGQWNGRGGPWNGGSRGGQGWRGGRIGTPAPGGGASHWSMGGSARGSGGWGGGGRSVGGGGGGGRSEASHGR
jgi:hypothetical protein